MVVFLQVIPVPRHHRSASLNRFLYPYATAHETSRFFTHRRSEAELHPTARVAPFVPLRFTPGRHLPEPARTQKFQLEIISVKNQKRKPI